MYFFSSFTQQKLSQSYISEGNWAFFQTVAGSHCCRRGGGGRAGETDAASDSEEVGGERGRQQQQPAKRTGLWETSRILTALYCTDR